MVVEIDQFGEGSGGVIALLEYLCSVIVTQYNCVFYIIYIF